MINYNIAISLERNEPNVQNHFILSFVPIILFCFNHDFFFQFFKTSVFRQNLFDTSLDFASEVKKLSTV